jgi:hypothetical protein
MALVLEILLGVAILASLVVAYFSARTWPIYQVVLVAFVFLGAVAFFYLSARTLATHKSWRELVERTEAELKRLEDDTRVLSQGGELDDKGVPNPKGNRQLRQDLQKLAIDRGGVIYDVAVEGVKDGTLQLALKSAAHGLVPGSVVFAFASAPLQEGGRYLGEFKVLAVGDDTTKVQVGPNVPLTEAQSQRMAATKGPLTLYMNMPVDDAAVFAGLDAATREALLPAASQPVHASAERKLYDYEQIFHENFVQRSLLQDAINKLTSNIQRMTAATQEAEKEAAYRESEKTNLAADLQRFEHERQAIAQYLEGLTRFFEQLRETMKDTFLANRSMAAALTAAQVRAADQIDRRSDAAAGLAPGEPAARP